MIDRLICQTLLRAPERKLFQTRLYFIPRTWYLNQHHLDSDMKTSNARRNHNPYKYTQHLQLNKLTSTY